MKSSRGFLYSVAGAYIVLSILGIALFKSPQLSGSYLSKYKEEHERYERTIKNPLYKLHKERPALHPLEGALAEDAEFVKEYAAHPEFHAEHVRILAYVTWFRTLNTATVFTLMIYFLRTPLKEFLDARIEKARKDLDEAAQARAKADQEFASAKQVSDAWPQTQETIRQRTEHTLEHQLAEIQEQTKFAQELIARDIENRKAEELHTAMRTLKEELVTQSVHALEMRYKKDATLDQLTTNVDQFVRLMDHLS